MASRRGWTSPLSREPVSWRGASVLAVAAIVGAGLGSYGLTSRSGGALPHALTAANAPAAGSGGSSAAPAPSGSPTANGSASSSPSPATPVKLGPKLSTTPYGSYAYRVYPGPLTSTAKAALAGFSIHVARSGAKLLVTVTVPGSGQPPIKQQYAASDQVYFVEANFGDDSGSTELNPGDDGLVVTNAAGRIIQ